MLGLLKQLFNRPDEQALLQHIRSGALLVDVRTPSEFEGGHVKGSVNIPLDQLPRQLPMLKDKPHLIVFCRSGNRSAMAKMLLERNGLTHVTNAGTWQKVASLVSGNAS